MSAIPGAATHYDKFTFNRKNPQWIIKGGQLTVQKDGAVARYPYRWDVVGGIA